MATKPKAPPTKRTQTDIPESWYPQIDASAEDEGRSRHNMILRFIREGLDRRGWKSRDAAPQ